MSDKQLAEIAKQQYEQRQISKVPSILVKLPSGGKVYPKTNPCSSGEVEMRYMTAWDEDILTNASYIKDGVVFDKLISSLVITPGFNHNTLIEADKEWLIISARITGYGSEYPVTVKTPDGNKINTVVDLNKLKVRPGTGISVDDGEFLYNIDDKNAIKFRYLSISELNSLPVDHAISSFLISSICEVNSNRDVEFIKNFIQYQLTPIESKNFRKHIQDTSPIIDLTYTFNYITKEGSEETFQSRFPIGSDFFWI
jgi:hypothetical protein